MQEAWFHRESLQLKGVTRMDDGGVFGGSTRSAVVFLIIFVLFILLLPFGRAGY
jgi:hypothetical protein